jgi:hypothetical protein
MAENSIMAADDIQKELDYYMALTFNDLLLDAGLITVEIHERAKREFIDAYKPALAPLMS